MIKKIIFELDGGRVVEVPVGIITEIERSDYNHSRIGGYSTFKVTFQIDQASWIHREVFKPKQLDDGNTINGEIIE